MPDAQPKRFSILSEYIAGGASLLRERVYAHMVKHGVGSSSACSFVINGRMPFATAFFYPPLFCLASTRILALMRAWRYVLAAGTTTWWAKCNQHNLISFPKSPRRGDDGGSLRDIHLLSATAKNIRRTPKNSGGFWLSLREENARHGFNLP